MQQRNRQLGNARKACEKNEKCTKPFQTLKTQQQTLYLMVSAPRPRRPRNKSLSNPPTCPSPDPARDLGTRGCSRRRASASRRRSRRAPGGRRHPRRERDYRGTTTGFSWRRRCDARTTSGDGRVAGRGQGTGNRDDGPGPARSVSWWLRAAGRWIGPRGGHCTQSTVRKDDLFKLEDMRARRVWKRVQNKDVQKVAKKEAKKNTKSYKS